MRIALFTETFLPNIDGVVNTLCHLLDYLPQHGHESLLFAPMGETTQYAQTPIVRFSGYKLPLYPDIQLVPPLVNIRDRLAHFRPDLVHVVNPISLGLAGLWHARRLRMPLVASYHTDVPGFAERWGLAALQTPIWAFSRWVHNQADLNLCPSQATLRELKAQGFENVQVWTRGVDTTQFHPRHRSAAWRRRLTEGHPEAPLLLFVSRLSPEKRADWLLPVLAALPGVRLAIVGDGPARPRLEQLFAGTPTVFTGYLRGRELAQAYAAGDVFVFPAANETLGNVVLEAMASGLPVVAARAGGPLDVVVAGETGLLFDPKSEADLVTAVSHLIHHPELARQLGRNGCRRAAARGWDAAFDGLLASYQAVIARAQAPKPLLTKPQQKANKLFTRG